MSCCIPTLSSDIQLKLFGVIFINITLDRTIALHREGKLDTNTQTTRFAIMA